MSARIHAFALSLTLLFPLIAASAQTSALRRAVSGSDSARARVVTTNNVPAPEAALGFRPGDDRKLASWASIVEYFKRLDAASDRVKFEELGRTTLDAPFVMATISAPENIARLDEYRRIQARLADPRTLGANPDRQARQLIARGKAVVLITCGIHSTEVGSYLSSTLIAHRLASSNDPVVQEILRNTIVLLVPSLNPDGVDIVKNWYDKTLGTPYEGTSPPELYQKYVGHDNNRDWYIFTQQETQLTVDKIHNVWHPQIVHDIHQQGPYGSRLFLPPYMSPVEPNVPRQLVEGYTELGTSMARRLGADGFKGITFNSTYDAWTPARAYSHYHGGVRILSETASARIATPINVKPDQIRSAADDGYDARRASPNHPEPWTGGDWRMRDITNYMTAAAFELMKHAAQNREAWLRRFYDIGKEAVRPRKSGELYAYVISSSPNTDALLGVLRRGGVEVERAEKFEAGGVSYPQGAFVVRMAQPYGNFAKALLENQSYPDLRDAAGHPQQPYDVTAHTLSLMMGVDARPVNAPFRFSQAKKIPSGDPVKRRATGDGRLAIYKSHVPSMDEGWTRWILENHAEGMKYSTLEDKEARAGNLRAKYDTILIPDHSPRALLEGYRKETMPEEYTGGLGEAGVRALREFVEAGGTLVCLNNASEFAVRELKLPVRDITDGLKRTDFFVPGSILRIELDPAHPLAAGMPRQTIAWVEDSPAFEIAGEPADIARVRIVARYPQKGTPLLSGWLLGEEKLRGRAALLEVGMGEGRVYLFGFRPQYRAQTLATYPLLFNALKRGKQH